MIPQRAVLMTTKLFQDTKMSVLFAAQGYANIIKTKFHRIWVDLFSTFVCDDFKILGRKEVKQMFLQDVFLPDLITTTLNLPSANCVICFHQNRPLGMWLPSVQGRPGLLPFTPIFWFECTCSEACKLLYFPY